MRCESCGGTRDDGAAACGFCGSDFTIHEQDMHTICPSCLARISDRARFCHHCATPIFPEETAGDETDRVCPACEGTPRLRSRTLAEYGLAVLECTRCAGLWLGQEAFDLVRERSVAAADPTPLPVAVRAAIEDRPRAAPSSGPVYRRCPVCGTLMTRFNYGRRSGILLDRCPSHGLWFDATELDAALRWIRSGGERLSAERDAREKRDREAAARFRVEPKAPEDARMAGPQDWGGSPDLLDWVVAALLGR